MSWGSIYDQKVALAGKVEEFAPEDQEEGFRDFVDNIQDVIQKLLETEVRYEATQNGLIASKDEVTKGVSYLKEFYFPELNDGLTASLHTFSNECHEENSGRFCETHGTTHDEQATSQVEEKRGFFKKLFYGSAEDEAAMDARIEAGQGPLARAKVAAEKTKLQAEAKAIQEDQKKLEKEQEIANKKWYVAKSGHRTKRAQQRTEALGQSINARQNDLIIKLLQEKS